MLIWLYAIPVLSFAVVSLFFAVSNTVRDSGYLYRRLANKPKFYKVNVTTLGSFSIRSAGLISRCPRKAKQCVHFEHSQQLPPIRSIHEFDRMVEQDESTPPTSISIHVTSRAEMDSTDSGLPGKDQSPFYMKWHAQSRTMLLVLMDAHLPASFESIVDAFLEGFVVEGINRASALPRTYSVDEVLLLKPDDSDIKRPVNRKQRLLITKGMDSRTKVQARLAGSVVGAEPIHLVTVLGQTVDEKCEWMPDWGGICWISNADDLGKARKRLRSMLLPLPCPSTLLGQALLRTLHIDKPPLQFESAQHHFAIVFPFVLPVLMPVAGALYKHLARNAHPSK